jgi:LAO/AO transport system kinase
VALLSHAGFTRVIVETVGAGQSDLDIMTIADCVIVVNVPGLGDQVQALKSGIMEIGDVYVVNKSDRAGAPQTHSQIEHNLSAAYMGEPGVNTWKPTPDAPAMRLSPGQQALIRRHGDAAHETTTWRPPVLDAIATDNTGIADICAAVDAYLTWQRDTSRMALKHRERLHAHLLRLLMARLAQTLAAGDGESGLAAAVSAIVSGERSPLDVVEGVLKVFRV